MRVLDHQRLAILESRSSRWWSSGCARSRWCLPARAITSALKMSATRPIPRCEMSDLPLDETMPADSCPRCCKRVESEIGEIGRLRMAVDAEDPALLVETVEFRLCGRQIDFRVIARQASRAAPARRCAQFSQVFVDRSILSEAAAPGVSVRSRADHRHSSHCRKRSVSLTTSSGASGNHHGRAALRRIARGRIDRARKAIIRAPSRPVRIEARLRHRDRKPAFRNVVS